MGYFEDLNVQSYLSKVQIVFVRFLNVLLIKYTNGVKYLVYLTTMSQNKFRCHIT